jgi:NAD(P)-dependent dehydrogenase (short-subunit alcohol dehydrogenase family)
MPLTIHYHELKAVIPSQQGKIIAITGCTSGTGLVLAKTCAELGARVILLNRKSERADAALKELQGRNASAQHVELDLSSFASVRACAEQLHKVCPDGIDVLCNNAGVMGLPDDATGDGFDVQMQSNHISHFLLTLSVWDLLERAAQKRGEARVVNHSRLARLLETRCLLPLRLLPRCSRACARLSTPQSTTSLLRFCTLMRRVL